MKKQSENSVENFDQNRLFGDEPSDLDSARLQVEDILHGVRFKIWIQERIEGVVAIL